MEKFLFLDENGMRQYEESMQEIKEKLTEAEQEMSAANGHSDSADREIAIANVVRYRKELQDLVDQGRNIRFVSRNHDESVIDIGDEVECEIHSPDAPEVKTKREFRLATGFKIKPGQEVSPSSPLGSSILGKSMGDEFSFTTPNGETRNGVVTNFQVSEEWKQMLTIEKKQNVDIAN